MKNNKQGTAHKRHLNAIFRAVEHMRGPVDLSELERDLAEVEDQYWSTDFTGYFFSESPELRSRKKGEESREFEALLKAA